MSTTYQPTLPLPEDLKPLVSYLRRELVEIKRGMEDAKEFDEFVVLYATPKRVRAGMVVYADGTTWNPGSGEGMYRRNVANNAWVFLG